MGHEIIRQLKLHLELPQDMGVEYVPRSQWELPLKGRTPGQEAVEEATSGKEVLRETPESPVNPQLEAVRAELGECKRCPLWEGRNHLVFGEGNPFATLMFVGEAPGREEDLQGRPFVGQAGKLLTQFLQAIGLSREDVYIANILKCRPPGNRTPQPQEIEQCFPFLLKQIQAINPKIICCLGGVAAQTLMGQKVAITRLRGQFIPWRWGIELFLTFHPAYLLRNPGQKKNAMQDFLKLKERLEALARGEDEGP